MPTFSHKKKKENILVFPQTGNQFNAQGLCQVLMTQFLIFGGQTKETGMTGHYGITVESKFKGLLQNFRTCFTSYCPENLSSGTTW